MISELVLKYLKGQRFIIRKSYSASCSAASQVPLTAPSKDDTAPRRVSGAAIEARLAAVLTRLMPGPPEDPLASVTRVEIHMDSVELLLPVRLLPRLRPNLGPGETAAPDPADPSRLRLSLSVRLRTRGGRTEIIGAAEEARRPDPVLIGALRTARKMLDTDRSGAPTLDAAPDTSYRRRLIRLAFLAPDLQRAILAGRQPPGLTLAGLMSGDMPLSWSEQHRLFGPAASN